MAKVPAKQAGIVQVENETALLWKATLPLSEEEHEHLSNKLRFEQVQSGLKIILVPYSVEATADPQALSEKTEQVDPVKDNQGVAND
ncbi:hypothetical protein [Paenibacillus radicis (ex Xue et al. 2023)]|uniref:Uncharacterized protein n=1 Tax=Paenibacillus radicis (ex Xue et al. 2023) TaxID=2972489 RepID=A0ABT1YRG0_9BACL|nr:hypothetical protein [Paenibacillus radicis (ex Xue et al. 2023)]MCR8635752.1 hypothetical protein [Paenibacillus radicis (ex Xue et al. 2023)]